MQIDKKRKLDEIEESNIRPKKGKLATVMISNIPDGENQFTLDKFLKGNGIICWGCRANFTARLAFIDVEVCDCEKTLSLNEAEWNGSEIEVKFDNSSMFRKKKITESRATVAKKERDERTLCFKNVPYDIFASKAESLLRGIKSVNLVRNKFNNKPTGIAFVEFFTKEEMETAYSKKHTIKFGSRKVKVIKCNESRMQAIDDLIQTNPGQTTSSQIAKKKKVISSERKAYSKTAMISNFPKNQNQSLLTKFLKSKGIIIWGCRANYAARMAFVDIEEKDFESLLKLNKQKWNGCVLSVKEDATRKASNIRQKEAVITKSEAVERTLCCKNVPLDSISQAFEVQFKNVKEVRNLHDSSGQPTGIAYIEFFTKQAMEDALSKESGYHFHGRKLSLVPCGKEIGSALYEHCAASKSGDAKSSQSSVAHSKSPLKRKKNLKKSKGKVKKRK